MTRGIEIEETSNGFILKETQWPGRTYVFHTFEELVEWIKKTYGWK